MTVPSKEEIEALAAWLQELSVNGGKGVVNNIDARSLGRIANALLALSQQVEEARKCCDSYAEENQRISDERDSAYAKGAEAMREAIAAIYGNGIRSLPLPQRQG